MTGLRCPWDFLTPANVRFCEQPLCSWIREPSNTWSNAAYFVVGFVLWKRASKQGNRHLRWFAIVSIATGLGSAFFHMTGSLVGGGADYLGMFLATGLLTALNTRRWLKWSFPAVYGVFFANTTSLMFLVAAYGQNARVIYTLGAPCCLIELRLFFRDRSWIQYRNYLYSWALVGLAFLFWWLDLSGRLCDPDNHVWSGHALWHVFTAASFLPLYRYYEQFESLGNGKA